MKAKIHPKYMECKVTCGCGETFTTRATKPEINVEICSKCHPFFTGKQKLVDTAGRVEKFERRYAKFHAQAGARSPAPQGEEKSGAESVAAQAAPAEPSATQLEPAAAAAPAPEPPPAPSQN